ncbi:MAG: hypothetical protein ABGY71_06905 [bacterium]|nr:hypothetical protein [Planctomycetota bacterium]HIL51210.1 hypothetical protein [Planctomycetota bacterium]
MLASVSLVAALALAPMAAEEFQTDTFVSIDAGAEAFLASGDESARKALEGGRSAPLAWERAFQAWSSALAKGSAGSVVKTGARNDRGEVEPALHDIWPDRDGTFSRRHESLEYAILRRLSGLSPALRAAWVTRQEPRAQARLDDAAPDLPAREEDLARIEQIFPASRAAARACLELFELSFERGRSAVARSWLERAARHTALAAVPELARACATRRAALASATELASADDRSQAAWADATAFEPGAVHTLMLPGFSRPRAFARIDGPAGLAHLADGRLVVQTSNRVWILAQGQEERAFECWVLARELGSRVPRNPDRPGRDWPLLPTTDGRHIFVVAGRADGSTSNFVQKLVPPRDLDLPLVLWSLGGDGLYGSTGPYRPLDEVLGPGLWEFQPGPVLVDDLLLVQARQWSQTEQNGVPQASAPGEARSWLLALESATGRPRWRYQICRGTDVLHDIGNRFGRREMIRTPAEPPVPVAGRVFVGTNLGAGALLDLADGRLAWSFLNRRREPEVSGWQGPGGAFVASPSGSQPTLLWTPADAPELYALEATLDFDAGAGPLLARQPLAIGESERLLGGDLTLVFTYGRSASRRTLSAHNLQSGRRYDSIFLGREERFLGRALVGPNKILCLSNRALYRFDRQRELYLEFSQAQAFESIWSASGLWFRGERLWALANGGLMVFGVR